MEKVSPVKEKANRLKKFVAYAKSNELIGVFGVVPSDGMIADKLGYKENRFKTIINGNAHMSTIEKLANALASLCPTLNANYVIKGEKNMTKEIKPNNNDLPELTTVDMDDDLEDTTPLTIDDAEYNSDLDDLDQIDVDDLEELQPVEDLCEETTSSDDKEYAEGIAAACVNNNSVSPEYTPKTAKDKWEDAAIDLGITDVNDNLMSFLDHKMNRLHVFKAPEGKLPYRQEIYDMQAIGMGSPKVINYEDDKVKYNVNLALVLEGSITLDASSKEDANAKIFDMMMNNKFVVSGNTLKFIDVKTSVRTMEAK